MADKSRCVNFKFGDDQLPDPSKWYGFPEEFFDVFGDSPGTKPVSRSDPAGDSEISRGIGSQVTEMIDDSQSMCSNALLDPRNSKANEKKIVGLKKTCKRSFGVSNETNIKNMIQKGRCPSTMRKNKWANNIMDEWIIHYNRKREVVEGTSASSIVEMQPQEMADALEKFECEVRQCDGKEYPPHTLRDIIISLKRHLRDDCDRRLNLMDLSDPVFGKVAWILDAKIKKLTQHGLGLTKRQAKEITLNEENILFEKKLLGLETSQMLLNTVFYYICVVFGLRGGQEHRNLKRQMFRLHKTESHRIVRLLPFACKNYQGGLKSGSVNPKPIEHIVSISESNGNAVCVFKVFKTYLSAISEVDTQCDFFYHRALYTETFFKYKFACSPIGPRTLQNMMATICLKAGLEGYFTNHSGRRTLATRLYNAGVAEQWLFGSTNVPINFKKYKLQAKFWQNVLNLLLPTNWFLVRQLIILSLLSLQVQAFKLKPPHKCSIRLAS